MRISDWSSDVCSSDLRFRWRSSGVKALDAVHGPTLTIEGRDESGAARSWYVRLWNYAQGSGEDAVISLDRSEEHTSELQSLMRISYAVFCLKKNNTYESTSHRRLHIRSSSTLID